MAEFTRDPLFHRMECFAEIARDAGAIAERCAARGPAGIDEQRVARLEKEVRRLAMMVNTIAGCMSFDATPRDNVTAPPLQRDDPRVRQP